MTTQEIIQTVNDAGYTVEETRTLSNGQLALTIAKDGNQRLLGVFPSITPADLLTTIEWMETKQVAGR